MIITEKKLDETDKMILKGLLEGLTTKEIAPCIEMSVHTVSIRIREMKKYYGCKSIVQLVDKTKDFIN